MPPLESEPGLAATELLETTIFPSSIAVDNQGGVYITGGSSIFDVPANFFTVRYDAATGEQTWVSRFDGPDNSFAFAKDIAIDRQGGVYVTGYSSSRDYSSAAIVTLRYNAVTGEEVWISRDDEAHSNESATAIVVDNKRGVYVTGYSNNDNFTTDYVSVRYEAATGEQMWASRYSSPKGASMDSAAAITVDSQGGVYVTGVSAVDSTNTASATVRYDAATGEESWASRYGGGDNSTDAAPDICVDSKGSAYVTGYSGSAAGGYDYTTVRYEAPTAGSAAIAGETAAMTEPWPKR